MGRTITHTIRGTVTMAARTTPNIERADPGESARLGPGLLDRGNLRRGFIHLQLITDFLDFPVLLLEMSQYGLHLFP